jgi:hypothetical protein
MEFFFFGADPTTKQSRKYLPTGFGLSAMDRTKISQGQTDNFPTGFASQVDLNEDTTMARWS